MVKYERCFLCQLIPHPSAAKVQERRSYHNNPKRGWRLVGGDPGRQDWLVPQQLRGGGGQGGQQDEGGDHGGGDGQECGLPPAGHQRHAGEGAGVCVGAAGPPQPVPPAAAPRGHVSRAEINIS